MMARGCCCGAAELTLWREIYDAVDRVFVGFLTCDACGRDYVDQRKPTQHRPESQVPRPRPSVNAERST